MEKGEHRQRKVLKEVRSRERDRQRDEIRIDTQKKNIDGEKENTHRE